jgi:hypothetical protein
MPQKTARIFGGRGDMNEHIRVDSWLLVGLLIGLAIGFALDNVGVGIAIGAVIAPPVGRAVVTGSASPVDRRFAALVIVGGIALASALAILYATVFK